MDKILIKARLPRELFELLEEDYEIIMPESKRFTKNELIENIEDVIGVITPGQPLGEDVLKYGKNLKFVATSSAGFDHIDLDYCNKNNIAVINAPNAVQNPTAELAIGLIINLIRRIPYYNKKLKEELYVKNSFIIEDNMHLEGMNIGIIGLGSIGSKVAQVLYSLGADIYYTGPNRKPDEEKTLNAQYLTFDELIETSDIVSLHNPYTEESHHMINEDVLRKMKTSAYLINVARGKLVDEKALIWALKNDIITGAALDVFEFEPKVSEELRDLDNVIITPHMGTLTKNARRNMILEAVKASKDFLDGKKPRQLVNKDLF